jgi:hypothetical protein
VRAWIATHVEITGAIEQPHVRPWATALRAPTPDGAVWFKAAREGFAHEGPVLEAIGPLAPDLLPEVIAARPEAGWLLLADAGLRVREHPIDWRPLLAGYAALQIAAAPLAGRLLELGAPDNRPPALVGRIEALMPSLKAETRIALEERLPELGLAFAALEASPLPPTIEHGDLHDGNVFVRDGRPRILDWGDSAVGHPFLTLTVEEDPAARDAYLEPFTAFASRRELDAEVEIVLAYRLLLRALNWERVLRYDQQIAGEIELRVAAFLRGSDL